MSGGVVVSCGAAVTPVGLPRCMVGRSGSSLREVAVGMTPESDSFSFLGLGWAGSRWRRVGRSGSSSGIVPVGGRGGCWGGVGLAGLAAGDVGALVVVAAFDVDGVGGGLERGGFFGWGGLLEVAVTEPGADGGDVCGRAGREDVAGVVEVEGADGLAGLLDGVDVAGLQGEGHGLREVEAGVFHAAVDEEGDGDEASGGGLGGVVAGVLVDRDGAGDFFRGGDFMRLGDGRKRGAEKDGDGEAARHGCL